MHCPAGGAYGDRSRAPADNAPVSATAPLTLADFDFGLPPELIAQHPRPARSASRLLDRPRRRPVDRVASASCRSCCSPATCSCSTTRALIMARLRGRKASGGAVELLVERVVPPAATVLAHLRASKSPRPGAVVHLADGAFDAEVLAAPDPTANSSSCASRPTLRAAFEAHLPRAAAALYITHADDADDAARYQTVFAARAGAVAAPTASLRFDEPLLAALAARVLATARSRCTSAPASSSRCAARASPARTHAERYEVGAEAVAAITAAHYAAGGRIVAAGTTVVRSVEVGGSAARFEPAAGETQIFITPGFVPRRRSVADQFPPAAQHAADARLGLRRPRTRDGAVPARSRSATASSAMGMRCCWRVKHDEFDRPSCRSPRSQGELSCGGDAGLLWTRH